MTSKEIIDSVLASVNAQIARRMATAERLHADASKIGDFTMMHKQSAVHDVLERLQKDMIQVEMNAKISFMGINTD